MQANLLHSIQQHNAGVYDLDKGPNNTVLSASADHFVASWNIDSAEQDKFAIQLPEAAYSVKKMLSSKLLLVGCASGRIHVIDTDINQEVRLMEYHKKVVFDFVEIEEQEQILSLGGDGSLALWNSSNLDFIRGFPLAEQKLRAAVRLSTGDIAIACADGSVRILEKDMLNEIAKIEAHDLGANCLAQHPQKPLLVTGGRDAYLRFWNMETWKLVREIPAHNFAIYDLAFSLDGKFCATASFDKSLKVWDTNTFDEPVKLDAKNNGHRASVNSVFWHKSGVFVSGSDDKTIKLWEVRND